MKFGDKKIRFFPPCLTIDERYDLLNGKTDVVSNRKPKIYVFDAEKEKWVKI